jgi:putative glutamine amidotransferase
VALLPAVAVTGTTERIREVLRVRANVSYTDSLRGAGTRPFVLPLLGADDADAMLEGMDGLVLTGGEDVDPRRYDTAPHPALGDIHAERDAFELALVKAARSRRLPTLAICRGIQVANVALGGTLVQDIPSEWPNALPHDGDWARDCRVHAVRIEPDSRLARALGSEHVDVNSLHHQSVGRVAETLTVVARAPDGVIEGVEWHGDDWWMVGVQWHPEELTATPQSWDRALFAAFAAVAGGGALNSVGASALRS